MMSDTAFHFPCSGRERNEEDLSTIYFAGDFGLFDVAKNEIPQDIISDPVREQIHDSDLSVVNYEGVTSVDGEPVLKGGPTIEIDEACPRLLADSGFDVTTLANNHIVDLGPCGLSQTVQSCQKVGLDTVGVGSDINEAVSPLRITTETGVDISIFNFSERPIHEYLIDNSGPSFAEISAPKLSQHIVEERDNSDILIGVAHAGEIGIPIPPVQLQRRYHDFIDLGLDIVVAHHPHVPQGWERYRDGTIFYSLGNFLFNYKPDERPKQNWGLTLRVKIDNTGVHSVEIIPIEVVNRRVYHLGRRRDRDTELERLEQMATVVSNKDKLSKIWLVIAEQLFMQRKSDYRGNPERFLNRMVWDSHRYTTETALIKQSMDVEISDEVVDEAFTMWSWTGMAPARTASSKALQRIARTCYRGPVCQAGKRTGIDKHLRKSYQQLRSYLNKRHDD